MRLLLEGLATPEEMLADWHTLLPHYMQKWELNRDDVRPLNHYTFFTLNPMWDS